MTAIGPLTTTFQAPSSCTTNTPQIYQIWTEKQYQYVQGPLFKQDSDCYPSGYDASPSAYYSPGFCPHGYTAACTSLGPGGGSSATGAVQGDAETALICCPTGPISYNCLGSGSKASLGCTMTFKNAHAVIGVTVVTDGTIGSYTVVTEWEGGFAAQSIQVRFQSTDPVPIQTKGNVISTRSDTSKGASSTTVTTMSTPTLLTPTLAPQSKTDGVSTAAAVGIGVGSAVAALLAVGIIGVFFFLRWRRKRRRPPVPPKESSLYTRHTYQPQPQPRPPYELSEESSPRTNSRRQRLMSMSRRGQQSTRRAATAPPARPAELEAAVPASDTSYRSKASLTDNRSTPDSSNSGWTLRQQRGGVMPTPWI
ncbi:hypothetical protein B0H66DRAFT_606122 [Apodospora peruviana]|uniref:Uncharacterized protein n=1 Tax=Apodospora peruviana TaxID=516989 RepID=A0AAE0HYI8_9PEZI|nr:hypothetical protein B0H66DRAFT_606122 [Apodospora peruviana]